MPVCSSRSCAGDNSSKEVGADLLLGVSEGDALWEANKGENDLWKHVDEEEEAVLWGDDSEVNKSVGHFERDCRAININVNSVSSIVEVIDISVEDWCSDWSNGVVDHVQSPFHVSAQVSWSVGNVLPELEVGIQVKGSLGSAHEESSSKGKCYESV